MAGSATDRRSSVYSCRQVVRRPLVWNDRAPVLLLLRLTGGFDICGRHSCGTHGRRLCIRSAYCGERSKCCRRCSYSTDLHLFVHDGVTWAEDSMSHRR